MISDSVTRQQVRQLQMETQAELDRLRTQISELQKDQTAAAAAAARSRPLMNQQLRNTDHAHSVDTWFNAAPSGSEQKNECANVYAYEYLPVQITDAEILTGTASLKALTSLPFTAAMVGKYVVIEGAGAAGAVFGELITAFVSSGEVTLGSNAATTVSAAAARVNLTRLTHKNKFNTAGSAVNDALKDESHTDYAANITDPDWNKTSGYARIGGGQAVAGYPFGRLLDDGATHIPLHQLFPGRQVFARLNAARANPYVKILDRLFVGIYNNNQNVLDWVRGNNFTLAYSIGGTPTGTVAADYRVVIQTQSGYFIVSDVLSIPNAPNEASLDSRAATLNLSWTPFDGTINVAVYRKYAGGNVFLLEQASTISGSYSDINNPTRTDTATTAFPSFTGAQNNISAYWASSLGSLDNLAVSGSPWDAIEIFLPFPSSVNLAQVIDPHLLIGLTKPLATEISVTTVSANANVTAVAAIFNTTDFNARAYTIRNPATGDEITGTTTYLSASVITLSLAPTWSGAGILTVEDSQPNGLLFDLVGAANMQDAGDWTFHPDDNNRPQTAASTPNGSTAGGIGGASSGDTGGTGGIPYKNFDYLE